MFKNINGWLKETKPSQQLKVKNIIFHFITLSNLMNEANIPSSIMSQIVLY